MIPSSHSADNEKFSWAHSRSVQECSGVHWRRRETRYGNQLPCASAFLAPDFFAYTCGKTRARFWYAHYSPRYAVTSVRMKYTPDVSRTECGHLQCRMMRFNARSCALQYVSGSSTFSPRSFPPAIPTQALTTCSRVLTGFLLNGTASYIHCDNATNSKQRPKSAA